MIVGLSNIIEPLYIIKYEKRSTQYVLLYVSVDLFFRAVSSQVFSALQSLTSVFGMGTGGPFALETLTNFK